MVAQSTPPPLRSRSVTLGVEKCGLDSYPLFLAITSPPPLPAALGVQEDVGVYRRLLLRLSEYGRLPVIRTTESRSVSQVNPRRPSPFDATP